MTLPDERTNSLLLTRDFLRSLLDPEKTPRVPKSIRREAYYCLKHFPGTYDIEKLERALPDTFGKVYKEEAK